MMKKQQKGYGLVLTGILVAPGLIATVADAVETGSNAAKANFPKTLTLLDKPSAPVTSAAPLSLAPAAGNWDLSRYDSLYFQLRNTGTKPVTVWAQAENAGAQGTNDAVRTARVIEPKKSTEMRLRLMRRPQDPTYAPFKPFYMYYKNVNVRDNTIDPAAVARVSAWLDGGDGQIIVESVVAKGVGVTGPVPFLPFVDKYGQYKHTDWPDKIYSDSDFAARLKKEKAEMSAYPGAPDWDKWGGWKDGPKQKATGYFYPAKVDGKWWLVDPEGGLYWSYGPTGVGTGGEGTPVTGKESWFEQLPAATGSQAKNWGDGKGARYMYYEDGKAWKSFNYGNSNAERKYGPRWREATTDFLHGRLRNWGFNTIANWSDSTVYLQDKTPYVVAIHYGGPKLEHIPDVFSPEFEKAVRERMLEEKGKSAGDPWNIGYFVDNELAWSYMNKAEGAIRGALRADATSATKQALIADLKAKYGEIAALNTSWGTDYASWEAMQTMQTLPEPKNAAARGEDLGAFGLKFADKYFSTVRAAVKAVAPNNMYLGCRFHGHIDTEIVKIAAKYSDVVSWNVYEEPGSRLNRFIGVIDKPFIVGEFGIGSAPEQTPFRGEKLSTDPMERVRAMENWVTRAAVHPLVVGGHYFQFRDQPITGRPDGEATLRGFVNTADTPHFELVQANRRLGYGLYAMRAAKPAVAKPEEKPVKTEEKVAASKPKLTYILAEGSENWPGDKKQRVVSAMDYAMALYNSLGEFDKQARASYNAGTPTADGNYNGNIRFGGQIGNRVALHEMGHVLGIGTHPKWQSFIVDGKWTGQNALTQLRAFDGPDAVLYADRQHFWPYGLNFDKESSPEADRRHVLMVAAFRRDLGIVNDAQTVAQLAPPTLADRNFLTIAGDQWKLQWNDEFEGDKLDTLKWAIGLPWGGTDGTGRHHNDQYASYIMDDDINLRGGSLHLTTQKRDIVDKKGNTFHYSEGLITTSKSFRTKYGYFEIRAKMPTEAGAGTWPAFWTLSDGWPPEFDIIEYWGSDNRIHQGTVTRKADGGQRWDSFHQSQASISGWHTYGLEWGPGYQLYNIDGKITNSIYGDHLEDGKLHYLLLNSGVDARRPPRAGTTFPNDFEVQYVRVYARPDVPSLLNANFEDATLGAWGRWNEAAVVDYGAKSGTRCLRVDAGGKDKSPASSMQQKVFGLQPNTKYKLSAFARTTDGATARLGVKEQGAEELRTPEGLTKTANYAPMELSFTTGPNAPSATIYCWAEGDGSGFFDDLNLETVAK